MIVQIYQINLPFSSRNHSTSMLNLAVSYIMEIFLCLVNICYLYAKKERVSLMKVIYDEN